MWSVLYIMSTLFAYVHFNDKLICNKQIQISLFAYTILVRRLTRLTGFVCWCISCPYPNHGHFILVPKLNSEIMKRG